MQREYEGYSKVTGAETLSNLILDILKNDLNIRSGILGTNDKLEIVSRHLSSDRLKLIPVTSNIDEACRSHATGIIAFDNFDGNIFVSDSSLIKKLRSACESAGITLIDVMLFGTDDWLSLRRQNRL